MSVKESMGNVACAFKKMSKVWIL